MRELPKNQDERPPRLPPDDYAKQAWKEAELAFEQNFKAREVHAKAVEAYSVLGFRTLALSCAGGIAATLGFFSANYDRLSQVPDSLQAFNSILAALFGSLLLNLVAILFAYFSQVGFVAALRSEEFTYEHPYVRETTVSKKSGKFGNVTRWASIVSAVASAGCLVWAGAAFFAMVR